MSDQCDSCGGPHKTENCPYFPDIPGDKDDKMRDAVNIESRSDENLITDEIYNSWLALARIFIKNHNLNWNLELDKPITIKISKEEMKNLSGSETALGVHTGGRIYQREDANVGVLLHELAHYWGEDDDDICTEFWDWAVRQINKTD